MNTVLDNVPTSIDLAPLLGLRPEVDAMSARLANDTKPVESVYLDLEERCAAAERAFLEQMVAVIGADRVAFDRVTVLDGLAAAAALITGSRLMDALAEDVYAAERDDRAVLLMLRMSSEQGATPAVLGRLLGEHADELTAEGVAAARALIAGMAK